jgi:ADP-dependent NAD(P)H-hydrate dehydratase / NAD(P)H-hydrate epimerase
LRSIDVFGREAVPALTAAQADAWDRTAREQEGVPERVLMENAGRAVAAVVQELFPQGRVLGVVGSGHNGGDAFVALRVLQGWGRTVEWTQAGARAPALDVLHGHELPRVSSADLNSTLLAAHVVMDGILGTGAQGAPRADIATAIERINAAGRPVVAVDLPSGIDPTTGTVAGPAIQAEVTVAFGAPKVGQLLHPGRAHCGRLLVAEIGFPPLREIPDVALITPEWAHGRRPRRPPTAHKGTAGRLLLLAGSQGMAGAAAIAARAALHAGVGLLRIASTADNREILQSLVPEATFFDRAGELPGNGLHALVAGCGLGTDEPALESLERALDVTDTLPAALDADALNLLAERPDVLTRMGARRPLVLTPHVGEFVRISGMSEADIRRDPIGRACAFAAATHTVVLLKGQPSLIAAPDGSVLINTTGSSDLATGGTGDQLAGTIGAFLAAGVTPRDAAALGVFYGGRAADLAGRGSSLSPQDVSAQLRRAFRYPGARTSSVALPIILFDQPARW